MGQVYSPLHIYCPNDEGRLIICAWPQGVQEPLIPAPYSKETLNGLVYAAASPTVLDNVLIDGGRLALI